MAAPKTHGKGYKHLKEKDFDQIKLLQKAKVTPSQAATITGRSAGTVSLLYRATSWQDYKRLKHEAYLRQPSYRKRMEEKARKERQESLELNSAEESKGTEDSFPARIPVSGGAANPVATDDTTIQEILNDINYNLKGIHKRLKKIEHNQGKKRLGVF